MFPASFFCRIEQVQNVDRKVENGRTQDAHVAVTVRVTRVPQGVKPFSLKVKLPQGDVRLASLEVDAAYKFTGTYNLMPAPAGAWYLVWDKDSLRFEAPQAAAPRAQALAPVKAGAN